MIFNSENSKILYTCEMGTIYWYSEESVLHYEIVSLSLGDDVLPGIENAFEKIYKQFDEKGYNDIIQIYSGKDLTLELKYMKSFYRFANFLKSKEQHIKNICKEIFIVNDNYFIRTTVNGLIKIFGTIVPVELVENFQEIKLKINS